MADYARPGGQARWMRGTSEQIRRLRTQRPRRGGIPTVAFRLEGAINADRRFGRYLFALDPLEEGTYPEHKTLLGFDGMLDAGSVTIAWIHSALGALTWVELGVTVSDHTITAGGSNRVWLDVPVILEDGEWLRPEISVAPSADALDITVDALFEQTPV